MSGGVPSRVVVEDLEESTVVFLVDGTVDPPSVCSSETLDVSPIASSWGVIPLHCSMRSGKIKRLEFSVRSMNCHPPSNFPAPSP